jgi:hypothetical protein
MVNQGLSLVVFIAASLGCGDPFTVKTASGLLHGLSGTFPLGAQSLPLVRWSHQMPLPLLCESALLHSFFSMWCSMEPHATSMSAELCLSYLLLGCLTEYEPSPSDGQLASVSFGS